jgi:hypothetical protein
LKPPASLSEFGDNYLRNNGQTMPDTAYRLAEYKIIEKKHGELWWETHIGLGSLKSGKCFINGDILFLKPSDSKEPGFLKGEFLDHLNRLPKWEKTKYYCASYKMNSCKSGGAKPLMGGRDSLLPDRAIARGNRSIQKEIAETRPKSVKADSTTHISYRLQRYVIEEKNNGQLLWKSYNGLGRLKKGRCDIKGRILFLDPGETQLSGLKKRAFIQQLMRLPDWERTEYFCRPDAVYYSETGALCRRFGEDKDLDKTGTKSAPVGNKTFGAGINRKPAIVSKDDTKEKLRAFFKFCSLLLILILKLLFGCFQIIRKTAGVFIDRWTRFRG